MEKDSFETALQKIVLQSDENSQQLIGKESVWTGIKKTKPIKKWYYSAAAAVLILSISIGIFSIQRDKIISPIAKKAVQPQQELQKSKIVKEAPSIISQKANQFSQNNTIEKLIVNDTATGKLNIESVALTPPLDKEMMVATVQKPVENSTIVNEIVTPQPEFTVQFKRGKPIETAVEKQIKIAIAFNKLSFGRDTSTLVLANAKPNNPFKIKF
jgi:hypothetical protein